MYSNLANSYVLRRQKTNTACVINAVTSWSLLYWSTVTTMYASKVLDLYFITNWFCFPTSQQPSRITTCSLTLFLTKSINLSIKSTATMATIFPGLIPSNGMSDVSIQTSIDSCYCYCFEKTTGERQIVQQIQSVSQSRLISRRKVMPVTPKLPKKSLHPLQFLWVMCPVVDGTKLNLHFMN